MENEINLRSEEVQEILTQIPNWMIRWGTVLIFIILILLFALSYFIKYPDVITTQIVLTTEIPPQKVVAKVSGKIEALLVKDKAVVVENMPLAIIENAADYSTVLKLSEVVLKTKNAINFNFEDFKNAPLGEVETAFAFFQKEISVYKLNTQLHPFQIESKAQTYEATQLQERLNLLKSQKEINEDELSLQKNDLDRYETLYKKGVISTQEIEKQKLISLQAQRNYKTLLNNILQIQSSLNDLNKNSQTTHINENKESVNLERNVLQAFYQLKKALKDWELNYVLRASLNGKITFLQLWSNNQTVNSGEAVFAVVPSIKSNYIGKVKASAQNSGKIQVAQTVNIRLANFPNREFGILRGVVKDIALTPDKDGNLLIDVSLPNGLVTSYKKKITFRQEMSGTADIVTEDLRLIERLLYQFRDILRR